MGFRRRHNNTIDQNTRYFHLTRIETAALSNTLNLRNHNPARIAHRHRNRQHFECQRLFLHSDIAIRITRCAANKPDMNGEGLEQQAFLLTKRDQLDQIFCGARIHLAATLTRIDKSTKTHAGEMGRAMGCYVAKQMRDDALRQIIGLDRIGQSKLLQFGNKPPMPANDAFEQTLMRQMIEPALAAIALTGGIDKGEIFGSCMSKISSRARR